ncbi:hypothetical protein [Streptomyces anulatus]|uniref:hypothetical protein n=1 Tax=Streptomyces anulatus TaxID=1892 RepID=UPI0004C8A826
MSSVVIGPRSTTEDGLATHVDGGQARPAVSGESTEVRFVAPAELEALPSHHTQPSACATSPRAVTGL